MLFYFRFNLAEFLHKCRTRRDGRILAERDAAMPEAGREGWLWDAELKSFGLRLRRNGAKTYVLEYRPGSGGSMRS